MGLTLIGIDAQDNGTSHFYFLIDYREWDKNGIAMERKQL
jgi:hypothetical protein